MAQQSLSYVLAERPTGDIIPGQTLRPKLEKAPTAEDLKDGEALLETLYLSLDPTMRTWMNEAPTYLPAIKLGEVMRGSVIARVLASKSPKARPGDIVRAFTGWREHVVARESQFEEPMRLPPGAHTTDLLGVLGPTGMTAYFGLTEIGRPRAGETVVVSGAAGATGSVAGQLAKLMGARVVGIAGTEEKVRWLREDLGFDEALNYKAADFKKKFKEATPDMIDVYWDNVGGDILNMALARAAQHSRFVMCGSISGYNSTGAPFQSRYFSNIITRRIRLEGFIILDYVARFPEAREELGKWLSEGKIKRQETIIKGGLKSAEYALLELFKGANIGKLLVEVKNPEGGPRL
ncbi:NADP-dependent leukotriene b4 12-hydroxydehydrogenase [Pleurostoma richardsiae]|uniref:Dehydrogenase FUB6 n=1 Tax=Pleurostoma richardsiae TaxID=41990 RepID=A0AA38VU19_9PEZI|nr:NADP-dependent leukotriene b4 12-hydroxydehydrogenase [Pleurostoma richardsiae]